jgi:hypothetical protein
VTERAYQAKLVKKLKAMFPGCELLKNDSAYQQGIPDWTILYGSHWGMLEIKASASAPSQVNQEYFLGRMNDMSFAAKIYPENEEEVLSALQEAFQL